MEYENGNGRDRPIDVLTHNGVQVLTGQETIPAEVYPALQNIANIGGTYRVEDIINHWPGASISQEEFDRRLWSLKRGMDRKLNPFGVGQASYLVLDKPDA